MLHYMLAQVSIQLIFKNGNAFSFTATFRCFNTGFTQQQPCFGTYFALLRWLVSQPFFPLGGVGCFPMCSQKFVNHSYLHSTDSF